MKIKYLAFGLLLATIVSSCSSKRDSLSYFQDLQSESLSVPINVAEIEPRIEPYDELTISVTSVQPELSLPYNLPLTNPAASENGFISNGAIQQATYFVSSEGDIVMPILGKIHVAGLTTDQLADKLTKMIAKDIDDPMVVVTLMNFKINVGGEVTDPGQYTVRGKRFSILDALSTAGDLTPYGERTKVILIREEDGKRVTHELDLTSSDILTSPYFYLKQNDYVYVAPNNIKSENSKYNQNNAYKLTVISTIVSAASVVASLVIALAIK